MPVTLHGTLGATLATQTATDSTAPTDATVHDIAPTADSMAGDIARTAPAAMRSDTFIPLTVQCATWKPTWLVAWCTNFDTFYRVSAHTDLMGWTKIMHTSSYIC